MHHLETKIKTYTEPWTRQKKKDKVDYDNMEIHNALHFKNGEAERSRKQRWVRKRCKPNYLSWRGLPRTVPPEKHVQEPYTRLLQHKKPQEKQSSTRAAKEDSGWQLTTQKNAHSWAKAPPPLTK